MLSAFGYSIITIDLNKQGIPFLNIAQPYGNYIMDELHGEIQSLTSWVKYGNSTTKTFMVRVTYTKNDIIRELYTDSSVKGEKITGDKEKELMEKHNLEPLVHHNLGIVPAVFLQNIPKKNFIGGASSTL